MNGSSPLCRILVVGGSIAGFSAVTELRRNGYDGKIVVLEKDKLAPVRVPELSKKVLTGALAVEQIKMPWASALDVQFVHGAAVSMDPSVREVGAMVDGRLERLPFDGLIIATGADARGRLDRSLFPNMHVIRRASDAVGIRAQLDDASTVTVVGGGFLGLEVAASCLSLGKKVTLLEVGPTILSGRFGDKFQRVVMDLYEGRPLEIVFNCEPRIDGPNRIVLAESGRAIESDLAIWCVGAEPDTNWLADSGIQLNGGVLCDDMLRPVGTANIVAAGDLVRAPNRLYRQSLRIEHWTSAIDQGKAAARSLLGMDVGCFNESVPYIWSNIFDKKIEIVGTSLGSDRTEAVSYEDEGWIGERYFAGSRLLGLAGVCPANDPGLFSRMRRQLAQAV